MRVRDSRKNWIILIILENKNQEILLILMNSRNFTNFNEFYSKYLIQIKKFLNKKIIAKLQKKNDLIFPPSKIKEKIIYVLFLIKNLL